MGWKAVLFWCGVLCYRNYWFLSLGLPISHAEKYCWLICSKRKTLFVRWKVLFKRNLALHAFIFICICILLLEINGESDHSTKHINSLWIESRRSSDVDLKVMYVAPTPLAASIPWHLIPSDPMTWTPKVLKAAHRHEVQLYQSWGSLIF